MITSEFFFLCIARERENYIPRIEWKLKQLKNAENGNYTRTKKNVLLPQNWTPFHFKFTIFADFLSTCGCRRKIDVQFQCTFDDTEQNNIKIHSIFFYCCWLTNNFINCFSIYFDISSLSLAIKSSIDLVIKCTRSRETNWKDLNLHAFEITIGILQSNLIPSRNCELCSKYRLWRRKFENKNYANCVSF